MKPILIPVGKPTNTVDYSHGIITRHYEFNRERFYFSLYPELYPDGDGLDFTGRYLAVLLSVRGLETFYLTPDETGTYLMDDDTDSEANLSIESETEQTLLDFEGIHTLPKDAEQDEDKVMHWLQFDSEALLIPLMNTAITENK